MPRTHYEVLGVKKNATTEEIRAAYRKLVLKYHPDRSQDPKATDLFIRVTQAYEVLTDPARRKSYDSLINLEASSSKPRDEQVRTTGYGGKMSPGYPPPKEASRSRATTVSVEVTRLTMIFSRGQFGEAEALARRIIATDPRQPIPYAVLGDLARSKGNRPEAAKMFALAVQMDPKNALYQQRYEEIVRADPRVVEALRPVREGQLFAPYVGGAVVVLGCGYLALAREPPFMREISLISSWTLGLIVVLFLAGVALGAALSAGGLLEPLHMINTSAIGRPSPTLALSFVAAVSFWAAAGLYSLLGMSQKAFNPSTTRVLASVAAATAILALSAASGGAIDGYQVLLWGGNLVFLGSLTGWTVADSFRR